MPLDPKQLPPYYTKGTTTPVVPVTRLSTQTTIIESAGTAETDAGITNLQANTLNTNGDIITMIYWGNSYNLPTSATVTPDIFGNTIGSHTWMNNFVWQVKINILRSTSSILYYSSELTLNNSVIQLLQGSLGPIDFAIPQTTKIIIQAATDGNIRSTAGYTQLLKS